MSTLDKNWALNQLRHKRQTYIYMLGALALLNSPATESLRGNVVVLKETGLTFGSTVEDRAGALGIDLGVLAEERANNAENFLYSLEQLHKLIRRNVLSEAFETVKAYTKAQGITATFKAAPWYHFVRTLRDAVTHDFHWRIKERDLHLLPLTWGGKTIDAALNDTDLTGDFLNPELVYGLLREMEDFVQAN
ncbi:MAG: hypothetical protein ACOY9C_06540 [Pseudomonadota bacterium]